MAEPLEKIKEDQEILSKQQAENEEEIGNLLEDVDPTTGELKQPEQTTPEPPVVVPTPVGTKPEEPVVEDVNIVDDLESELEKIQPPEGKGKGKSATAQGYDALKERIRKENAAAKQAQADKEAAEKKAAELEEKLKTPSIPEETQKELEELRKFAREQDIHNDPEFRQKYTTRLQQLETEALDLLKASGLTEKTAGFVQQRGGIIAMAKSQRLMPDGKQTEQEWVEEKVLPLTKELYRDRIKKRIIDGIELSDEMGKEIEAAKKEAPQRQEAKIKQIQAMFEEGRDEELKRLGDRAKKLEIPTGATPEEKARIERHNTRVEKAEKAFLEFAQKGNNPKEAAKMLVNAAHSVYMQEALDEERVAREKSDKALADLQARYDALKSAGKHSRQGAAPIPSSKPQAKPPLKVGDEEALEAEFAKLDS